MKKQWQARIALTLVFLALGGLVASACDIPVFRYALEHWQAAPAKLTVYHRGTLVPAQYPWVEALEQSNRCVVDVCNLAAAPAASSKPDAPISAADVWNGLPHQPALPAVVMNCWGGQAYVPGSSVLLPFTRETVDLLANAKTTPYHREVARRLLAGDSAVWVVLTCADGAKNAAARKMLGETLKELARTLKLPHELDPTDTKYEVEPTASIPLKLQFSILEIPGSGFEADMFRGALREVTTNAVTTADPVVIPVFGRGLALDAFSGPTLDPSAITSVCRFLCGACSCSVKEMRLGVSLFMPINWEAAITPLGAQPEPLPPLTVPGATGELVRAGAEAGSGDVKPAEAGAVPAQTNGAAQPSVKREARQPAGLSRSLLVLLGIGVLMIVAGTFTILAGKK